MSYVFGRAMFGVKSAVLGTLQEVEDDYELLKGISRIKGFSRSAYFQMDDDFPKNLSCDDVLVNGNKLLVVSARLKLQLEGGGLKNNEFLPIRVLNHKARNVEKNYFIVHQLNLQDCIDLNQSDVKLNRLDPEKYRRVSKLVLDEASIDPDVRLLRMKRYSGLPIFRRDLAEEIAAGKFTGIEFGELADWNGSW